MDTDERSAKLALARCRTRTAPDDRVRVFDLDAAVEGETIVVSGTVSAGSLRDRALGAVEETVDATVVDDVAVLETGAVDRAVAEPVLSSHRTPGEDAERVTQVVYGQIVTAYDRRGGWRRIRTPAGYLGWVPADGLVPPIGATPDAVVDATVIRSPELTPASGSTPAIESTQATESDTYAESEPDTKSKQNAVERLYGGTPCERRGREGDGIEVAFATGAEATLPADAVASPPADPDGEAVVAAAATYLGTDYRWGGMTVDGIDCSGLVWMAYRRNGFVLPRDSDQQRAAGRPVERDDLAPGDLLFFPGHVAISAGGPDVVHAGRDAEGVVRASLDPGATARPGENDAGYSERLDGEYECARRLL